MLDSKQLEQFKTDGFIVCRGLVRDTIAAAQQQLISILTDQAKKFDCLPEGSPDLDKLILAHMKPQTEQRKFIYDFIKHVPAIRSLQSAPEIHEVLRDLGLRLPISLQVPTVRLDIPREEERRYMTLPHQDLRSIRSSKCITVWFPIKPVNEKIGTLAAYRGSHELGLVNHEIIDGQIRALPDLSKYDLVPVVAEPGDVLFANSFCIHETYREGMGGEIKVTAHFMFNDALAYQMDDEFDELKRKIPMYSDLYNY